MECFTRVQWLLTTPERDQVPKFGEVPPLRLIG